jgi:hypothetical protein
MSNLLPISPEVSTALGKLYIRQDLLIQSATIYFKAWYLWDVDTAQVQISSSLTHFIQPNGEIVGIKCFSAGGINDESIAEPHSRRIGRTKFEAI